MAEDNMTDIINNFKNMLKNSNISSTASSANAPSANPNLNITPDMISNLANVLQSSNSKSTNNSYETNNDDKNYNSSFDENNANFNSSFNKNNNNCNSSFNENNNTANSSSTSDSPFGNIDFETILKIKSIMETLNKNDDPRSNLLYSLKPYLRENRQKKLDQYANLFKITQVTNLFKKDKEKGDNL